MAKSLTILAAILTAALALAYVVSHPGDEGASPAGEKVYLWNLELKEINRVFYRDGEETVEILPRWREGKADPYLWVKTRHLQGAQRKNKKAVPAPPPSRVTTEFKGNDVALVLLKRLAHLESPRNLGPLAGLKAKEFGFPSQDKYLEIHREGKEPFRLELGGASVGGNVTYVHFKGDGNVYLLRRPALARFPQARTAFPDRRLFPKPLDKAAELEIVMDGKSSRMVRLEGVGEGELRWSTAQDKKPGDSNLQELVNRLEKISVKEYVAPGKKDDKPAVTEMEIKVVYPGEEGPPIHLKIYGGAGPELRAESTYTEVPVLLSRFQVSPLFNAGRRILKKP